MKLCDRPCAREVQSPGSHPQSAKQIKTKNSTQNTCCYTSFTEVAFCCSCSGSSCLGRTTQPQYLYCRLTYVTRQRTSLSGHYSSTSDPPQEGSLPAKPVRNLVLDPLQNYIKPRASPTKCSFPCRHADAMHPPLGVMFSSEHQKPQKQPHCSALTSWDIQQKSLLSPFSQEGTKVSDRYQRQTPNSTRHCAVRKERSAVV